MNPRLNAVLHKLPDEAHAEIRDAVPTGPFGGVPFLIKELMLRARGVRCDMGSRLAHGVIFSDNSGRRPPLHAAAG